MRGAIFIALPREINVMNNTINSLTVDIETYSDVDLKKEGVYRYAKLINFEILTMALSINDGETIIYDIVSGEEVPLKIIQAILDDSVTKWAHNAIFERICLSEWLKRNYPSLYEQYGRNYLNPACWKCTMVLGLYYGLPASLKEMGKALNLPNQKLEAGKNLIKYFCQPCKPTKINGGRTRNLPHHNLEDWKIFLEYNKRDVEVALEIKAILSQYPLPPNLWQEYALDQVINDTGILIDSDLVSNAVEFCKQYTAEVGSKLKELTGVTNPNSIQQMKTWLASKGIQTNSLDKTAIDNLLLNVPEEIKEILILYQRINKTSVSKYEKMLAVRCIDGRIRGTFQFYGANRTGRWAGRQVQFQNLPKGKTSDLENARKLVKAGNYNAFKSQYNSVLDTLSGLVRNAIIPSDDSKLIVADYSAIEARVLAFIANETWRLKVFENNEDLYCASASNMFGVPVEKNGINGELRQKGKIAELALGYGGSVGALKAMGADKMGLTEQELSSLVQAWRSANPNIVKLWRNIEDKLKLTILYHVTTETNKIKFRYQNNLLFIILPSGRELCYRNPKIELGKLGQEIITYDDNKLGKRIESYGAKFIENIVQGISRDILANAMINLQPCGRIVAHVHDEVVLECNKEETVETICEIMSIPPTWMPNINLKVEGFESMYYKK